MNVYRIARQRWISNFTGSGIPGRWNEAGKQMLYTASSLALALLEMLVHVDRAQLPDYMWVLAEVPDELITWPSFYGEGPLPSDTARYGTKWLETPGERVALAVPSVIIPEHNVLLNPVHTDFTRIKWGQPIALNIDPRLLRIP
jgi:RES domain-containing protein